MPSHRRRNNRGPRLVEILEPALVERFGLHGWKPGIPHTVGERASHLDAAVCCSLHCPHCKTVGLDYHPYQRGDGCRVIAACRRCGHAEERADMGVQPLPQAHVPEWRYRGKPTAIPRVYRLLTGRDHNEAG